MPIELPYYPRKYTFEWLETLRHDTGVFTDQDLEIFGEGCFPDSDDGPLGETDWHVTALFEVLDMLKRHIADQTEVYVAGENFVYWEPKNPKACVCPDVYIVKGAGSWKRRSFQTWKEGGLRPSVVCEFTSRDTKEKDFEQKLHLYQSELQVPEYFLFDPERDVLDPPITGFRLVDGEYQSIPVDSGQCYSEQLGLVLEPDGTSLRFVVPSTGERIPTAAELERIANAERGRAEAESSRAETEAQARQAAEAEIARLNAEIEVLRAQR